MKKFFLYTLISLGGLTACDLSGGGSGGGSATIDTGIPGAGGSITDLSRASNGWKTNCVQGVGLQYELTWQVSGNSITSTHESFIDGSNCNPVSQFVIFKTTFTASTEGTSSMDPTATNLNLTVAKIEVMPITPGTANDFNTGLMCGISDWQAGVYRDVTTTSCNFGSVYTLMKISGNNLYLGTSSGSDDGTTPEKRHTQIDTTWYFVKQ